jgi:HD superfamily phosphohydrolase YqeK
MIRGWKMGCEDSCDDSGFGIDLEGYPRLVDLFKLVRPYLEKNDFGLGHTCRVLEIARKYFTIHSEMEELVFATTILHDIGGSSVDDQYEKGPQIASDLLKTLRYDEEFVKEVCDVIKTHHDRPTNPSELFKILYDSDQLVKFSREEFNHYNDRQNFNWNSIIESFFHVHFYW